MQLINIVKGINNLEIINSSKEEITSLFIDSRKCEKGSLYVCLKGENADGHDYAFEAIKNGAVAVLCERRLPIDCMQIVCENTRKTMSSIAANFYENAASKLKIIAVTGTNGKTTTTYLIKRILEAAGHKVGLIGTNANYIGKIMLPPKLTTPDPIDLHELFFKMNKAGCTHVVMEASAHAIFLDKLEGIKFESAVLTNITQDHLDFFKNMENYSKSKISLLNSFYAKNVAINADDSFFDEAQKQCDVLLYSFSTNKSADIVAKNAVCSVKGSRFVLGFKEKEVPISLSIPGRFNVSNSLAAAAACLQVGISLETISEGLNNVCQVPGRFNIIETGLDFDVIVDYAHTPDGLYNILNSVKELTKNNVICVFGCGGNRDAKKRPIMGEIAAKLADYVVITSDNPRFENPEKIVEDIEDGIITTNYEKIVDRRHAIREAMNLARKGDVIIIAGKGAEDYQEINGIKHHFSDSEIVLKIAGDMHSSEKSQRIRG